MSAVSSGLSAARMLVPGMRPSSWYRLSLRCLVLQLDIRQGMLNAQREAAELASGN
jgi:hypothetical protein